MIVEEDAAVTPRRGLDALSAANPRWCEANGASLRYQLLGSGDRPVVLLHEMAMTLEAWDELIPLLDADCEVLRYDLRGFGLSEKIEGEIEIADEVADLAALLDAVGMSAPVTLIGGALGGAVALAFAAAHPKRVKAVCAISPAAYLEPQAERLAAMPPEADERLMLANIDDLYPAELREGHPERLAKYTGLQLSTEPGGHAASMRMLYRTGFAQILPRIACPVVIVATSLFARPVASFAALAAAIPNGRCEVIRSGHFAALATPELVAGVVRPLLADLGA